MVALAVLLHVLRHRRGPGSERFLLPSPCCCQALQPFITRKMGANLGVFECHVMHGIL